MLKVFKFHDVRSSCERNDVSEHTKIHHTRAQYVLISNFLKLHQKSWILLCNNFFFKVNFAFVNSKNCKLNSLSNRKQKFIEQNRFRQPKCVESRLIQYNKLSFLVVLSWKQQFEWQLSGNMNWLFAAIRFFVRTNEIIIILGKLPHWMSLILSPSLSPQKHSFCIIIKTTMKLIIYRSNGNPFEQSCRFEFWERKRRN